jgi:hypothetical protein
MIHKTGTFQEEALVQGLDHLEKLFPEEKHPEPSGERLLDIQNGMTTIKKTKDSSRLWGNGYESVGVVHGISETEDLLPPHGRWKHLHRSEPGILVCSPFIRRHGTRKSISTTLVLRLSNLY